MKDLLKRRTTWLAAAALVLVLGLSVSGAMAYFTTFAKASGTMTIQVGTTTKTKEPGFSQWTKHVQVENTGDVAAYVRVKAFAGDTYSLTYTPADTGAWTLNESDGYYYYSEILDPGKTTSELLIKISDIPEESKDSFNVVVIQECTQVLYDENGDPYADWNQIMDVSRTSASSRGEADQ